MYTYVNMYGAYKFIGINIDLRRRWLWGLKSFNLNISTSSDRFTINYEPHFALKLEIYQSINFRIPSDTIFHCIIVSEIESVKRKERGATGNWEWTQKKAKESEYATVKRANASWIQQKNWQSLATRKIPYKFFIESTQIRTNLMIKYFLKPMKTTP